MLVLLAKFNTHPNVWDDLCTLTSLHYGVREFMEAHPNQQMFLSNEGNKCQFISLLHQYLESDGQIVHTSRGDADTLIVTKALSYAAQGKEVNVVADDTDILVLLMYHWTEGMADVYSFP